MRGFRSVVSQGTKNVLNEVFEVFTKEAKRRVIWRTWGYLRPYWPLLTLLVTFILCIRGMAVYKPVIVRSLIDDGISSGSSETMARYCVMLLVVPIATSLLKILKDEISQYIFDCFSRDIKAEMFAHYQDMSLRFFIQTKKSEVQSRFNNDFQSAQTCIVNMIGVFGDIVQLISTLFAICVIDFKLSIFVVTLFPIFFIPARLYARSLKLYQDESSMATSEYRVFIADMLSLDGILLTKVFGLSSYYRKEFNKKHTYVRDTAVAYQRRSSMFWSAVAMMTTVATAFVWWWCGSLVIGGQMKAGLIYNYVSYIEMVYTPLGSILNSYIHLLKAVMAFERIFQVLDLPIEIQEVPNPFPLKITEGGITLKDVWFSHNQLTHIGLKEREKPWAESLKVLRPSSPNSSNTNSTTTTSNSSDSPTFSLTVNGNHEKQKRVKSFSFPDGDDLSPSPLEDKYHENADEVDIDQDWTLKGINLHIAPKSVFAIVGPSGAGKSTLLHLLIRLIDPRKGSVEIDGQDLRVAELKTLTKDIALVPQDCILFSGSIKENLQIANLNANEQDMIEACEAARIMDRINELPNKLDTLVGERGHSFSGGERQRLSIARALLRKPKILILDEATSSLDSLNEQQIQGTLSKIFSSCTVIIVAHRLSTIVTADHIVVMDDGRIKEQGTHHELLEQNGLYHSLYHTQLNSPMDVEHAHKRSRDLQNERKDRTTSSKRGKSEYHDEWNPPTSPWD